MQRGGGGTGGGGHEGKNERLAEKSEGVAQMVDIWGSEDGGEGNALGVKVWVVRSVEWR